MSPLRHAAAIAALAFAPLVAGATEVVHLHQDLTAGARLPGHLDGLATTARGLTLAAPAGTGAGRGIYESGPIAAPLAFTAVGPHWRARLPAGTWLRLELATSADGVVWSAYHEVEADSDSQPAARLPDGSPNPFHGDTVGGLTHRSRGDGRFVRYRLSLGRDARATANPAVDRLTLTFIDSRRPYPQPEVPPSPAPPPDGAPAGYPKPPVYGRGQWGARPPICTYSYCTVTHIGVHHTAGVAEYTCSGFAECAADVRAIQAFHMDVNGWCDIGYNYLASSDGALWEGRGGGDDVNGAHDGYNCGSMGVSNMGYYHPPYNHVWTEAQIDAVAELSAWKCDQKGIDPFGASWYAGYGGIMDNVYGHRDVSSTACPGDNIYFRLGELRDRIGAKLDGGGGDMILDNDAALPRGSWTTGTSAPDKYGPDYLWTSTGTGDVRTCRWSLTLPAAGTYEVAFWWSQGSNRNPSTTVGVKQGSVRAAVVNQQVGGGRWNPIGTYSFTAGQVQAAVSNLGPGGYVVICDAVRFRRIQ